MLKRVCLSAAIILATTTANANTFVVSGFVTLPTGPDSTPTTYGYDNGGYFGTQYSNLGGLPFSVTWTGTNCNCYGGPISNATSPITGATLTINGVTVNMLVYGGVDAIWQAEWLNQVIQVQTRMGYTQAFPPFSTIYYGSENSLTTWDSGGGVFYLHDINHSYTRAYLTVTDWGGIPVHGVPGPIIGSGLPGLGFLMIGLFWLRNKKAPALRPGQ